MIFFPSQVQKITPRLQFYCPVGYKPVPYPTQQSDFSIPFPTDIYIPVSHILIKQFSLSFGSFINEFKL